jgi:hypothetical protein
LNVDFKRRPRSAERRAERRALEDRMEASMAMLHASFEASRRTLLMEAANLGKIFCTLDAWQGERP